MSEIWPHVRDPEIRENFACGIGNPNFHGGQLKFWGEGGSKGRNFCGSGRWLLEVLREVSIVQEEVFYLIFTKLFNVSFNAIISGPGLQDFCVRDNNCHDERLERELKFFIYLFIFPIPSDMSLALRSLHSEIIFLKKCEIYLVPIH